MQTYAFYVTFFPHFRSWNARLMFRIYIFSFVIHYIFCEELLFKDIWNYTYFIGDKPRTTTGCSRAPVQSEIEVVHDITRRANASIYIQVHAIRE